MQVQEKNAKLGGVLLYGEIRPNVILTAPVKIDGRQQHEETCSILKTGDQCIYTWTSAGFRVPCLHGKLAKLVGVVPYGYIHPITSIQSLNRTGEN